MDALKKGTALVLCKQAVLKDLTILKNDTYTLPCGGFGTEPCSSVLLSGIPVLSI